MQALQTLIDKASHMCGGQNALARELKISSAYMSQLRTGKRPVTPAIAAVMADIAHENVAEAIGMATLASVEGGPLEYRLGQILGKGQAAGGAAGSQKYYSGRLNITNESDKDGSGKRDSVTNQFTSVYIVLSGLGPPGRAMANTMTAHRGGFFSPALRTNALNLRPQVCLSSTGHPLRFA